MFLFTSSSISVSSEESHHIRLRCLMLPPLSSHNATASQASGGPPDRRMRYEEPLIRNTFDGESPQIHCVQQGSAKAFSLSVLIKGSHWDTFRRSDVSTNSPRLRLVESMSNAFEPGCHSKPSRQLADIPSQGKGRRSPFIKGTTTGIEIASFRCPEKDFFCSSLLPHTR